MPFMDHFLEEVVTKRNNTVNRIIYYFSWVIMIIAAVFASRFRRYRSIHLVLP